MNAVIRTLRAPEPATPSPAAAALAAHREAVARLNSRADDVRQRIEQLTELLRSTDAGRARVADLRSARQAAAGKMIAEGRSVDLRDHDSGIRAAEAQAAAVEQRLAQYDGRASIEAAIAHLCERQRQHSAEAAALAASEPRLQLNAALEHLANLAPKYAAGIASFVDTLVEVGAAARAVDLLAARVPGSNGVASGALLRTEIGRPNHPAYSSLPPISDYGARISRMCAETLATLGAGALAR